MKRLSFVLVSSLLLVSSLVTPAFGHARLISSQPGGGATVAALPGEVVLQFSERIETSFGGVQVFGPKGARLETGEPQIAGSTVRMQLPELPGPGDYTVLFRIISGDSHPVESRFAFAYRQAPESPATPGPAEEEAQTGPRPMDVELQSAGPGSSAGLWASRLLNYIAMTLFVGLLLAAALLLNTEGRMTAIQRRALRIGSRWGLVWTFSCLGIFVFGLSVAAALPLSSAIDRELFERFADTRLGLGSAVQSILALLLAGLTFVTARTGNRRLLVICAGVVALAALVPGYWGHAGTSKLVAIAMASDWAHVVSVTSWVGGLAVLAFLVLGPGTGAEIVGPANKFSRIAGTAVFVVLLTGAINAVLRIRSVGELTSTSWGRLVLLKLVLFGIVAALGWRNRSRMLPAIAADPEGGRKPFRKYALIEAAFMLAALAAATGLASTIPSDAEAASRIQSIATAFGEGQINLTVDPATTGDNLMHLYFLDINGQPLVVTDPSMTMSVDDQTIQVEMFESGPGHYTALSQRIDLPGEYRVGFKARVDGAEQTSTGTVTFREA